MAIGAPGRLDRVDQLRALAMLWMTVFHFCFDLNHFGFMEENFYRDPFWTWQRTAIVSLFLFTAGLSQAIASANGQDWSRFWRRWVQIAAAALLVSFGSWLMFPKTFIYFGVLHGVAVMLVVARITVGWGVWLWPLGALAISVPMWAPMILQPGSALEFLNTRGWNALGFISRKPVTEDYVPLLPWLGVVWWGVAAGQWMLRRRPGWLGAGGKPLGGMGTRLAVLGRWSLSYYLLHQPVMIGLLGVLAWALR
ncbi:MAG: DUF1624 domain-containing protein [Hydrogenophaga sp.]|jgi:uncharacterized membrane protein|nr:DUF1624 domain-containing protein [Hydrogenophaga sp.]